MADPQYAVSTGAQFVAIDKGVAKCAGLCRKSVRVWVLLAIFEWNLEEKTAYE